MADLPRNAHAMAFNALTRALGEKGEWVPLSARLHATDKVLEALAEAGALTYEPFVASSGERDVIDMGFLSLPAEIQAEAAHSVSADTRPSSMLRRVDFAMDDEPVADVVAAFEAGEKGVTRRPASATAIRGALYDSLSPNFEIDSDGYDDAAVAVAKLVDGVEP